MSSLDELEKVEWAANQKITDAGSAVGNSLSAIGATGEGEAQPGFFASAWQGVSNFGARMTGNDVIGIDAKEIPNMKSAVQTYVTTIQDKLNEIDTTVATDIAFKGTYADAVTSFTKSIKTACLALTSQMLSFNEELDKVQATFEAKDTTMSSTISGTAADVSSAANANTYGSNAE